MEPSKRAVFRGGNQPRLIEREPIDGVRLVRAVGMKEDFRRHSHSSIVAGVVNRGLRRFRMRHDELVVETGNGFLIPAGLAHRCLIEGGHGYRVVGVRPDVWKTLTGSAGPARAEVLFSGSPPLRAVRKLIGCLHGEPDRLLVESCLVALHESLGPELQGQKAAGSAALPERVVEVRDWLAVHYAEAVSLTKLAEIAGCSASLINRSFSQFVGLPPHEYLMQLRLRCAARRLREGSEPLAEIALDTGFSDQSHFQRFFRRAYGTTPLAYREASVAAVTAKG